MSEQAEIVLIAGPTASGKSALALRLAERFGGAVVNADSMQVYRDLEILTARPGPQERARAEHMLYGHVPACKSHSVGAWVDEARQVIGALRASGRPAIFCGGTGLYFRALEQGLSVLPQIDAQVRGRWRSFARRQRGDLHGELAARDPQGAALIDPGDTQRLVRAIEVIESTGRPLRDWQGQASTGPLEGIDRIARYLVLPERADLVARIDNRFDAMIAQGAVDEVAALLGQGLDPELPAMKAIGVREIAAFLSGDIPLEDAVRQAKTATRQYAKRQATWFRHQTGAAWQVVADPSEAGPDSGLSKV